MAAARELKAQRRLVLATGADERVAAAAAQRSKPADAISLRLIRL